MMQLLFLVVGSLAFFLKPQDIQVYCSLRVRQRCEYSWENSRTHYFLLVLKEQHS